MADERPVRASDVQYATVQLIGAIWFGLGVATDHRILSLMGLILFLVVVVSETVFRRLERRRERIAREHVT